MLRQLEHRRSNIEVIADILRQGEGCKTEIMCHVGLRYDQLNKYISRLLELRLVYEEKARQHPKYIVTQKGHKLLREIDILLTLLKGKEVPQTESNPIGLIKHIEKPARRSIIKAQQ